MSERDEIVQVIETAFAPVRTDGNARMLHTLACEAADALDVYGHEKIEPLNCFVCDKSLETLIETANQPSGAVVFRAYGQFGSKVFDPFDGSFLEVNICDSCISANQDSVWHYPAPRRKVEQGPPRHWNPDLV